MILLKQNWGERPSLNGDHWFLCACMHFYDLFWNHFCVSVNILCWKLGVAEQQTVESKQS